MLLYVNKNILCISCSSLITQEMRHPLSRTKTWRHRHKPLFPNFEPGLLLCGIFLVMLLDYLTYPSVSCTKCVCPYPSIHIKIPPLVYLIISIIKRKLKTPKNRNKTRKPHISPRWNTVYLSITYNKNIRIYIIYVIQYIKIHV